MFAKGIFLFAVVAVSSVTSNPLLQAIISQTCPICEQNALKNQIQNLLLQTASNMQPYPAMYMNQNSQTQAQSVQPVEVPCPLCPQNRQNQNFQVNQSYYPQQTIKPTDSPAIPEAINKILSNPNLKSILDPNNRLFNQNGQELSRNRPKDGTPNVINNYIIVPPEFLLEDNTNSNGDRKSSENKRSRNSSGEINKRKQMKEETDDVKPENNADKGVENSPKTGERKQRRRQKNRNSNVKVNIVNENKSQQNNQMQSQPMDKKENDRRENLSSNKNENNAETTTVVTTLQNAEEITVKKEIKNPNAQDLPKEVNYVANKDVKHTQNQAEKQNSSHNTKQNHTSKETSNEKLKRTNSQNSGKKSAKAGFNPVEETVIRDIRYKFPNIPGDVVRNLLEHMKRQLQKQNFDAPTFYYPQFPITYDQLFRNQFPNIPTVAINTNTKKSTSNIRKSSAVNENPTNDTNRKVKRRKDRREQDRIRKLTTSTTPKTSDTTVNQDATTVLPFTTEMTTPLDNTFDITIASTSPITTERTTKPPTTIKRVTEPIVVTTPTESIKEAKVSEPKTKDIVPVYVKDIFDEYYPDFTRDHQYYENRKEIKMPELGTEDVVPTVYVNELYDEYYPDFARDRQYYSNEDISFIRLEDDRYHYTTDKNFPLEELNRERRRFDADTRKYAKRPQNRYILRRNNRYKSRPNVRMNTHERKGPRTSTILKPGLDMKNNKHTVKLILKNDRSDFIEHNTERPMYTHTHKEEIQFRTPPTLEKIDFETKQINKKKYDENIDVKMSSYSEAKTPQYHYNKNDEIPNNLGNKQIETVCAKSKVVTYGRPSKEAPVSIETVKDFPIENNNENDGYNPFRNDHKTIVLGRSVDGDFW